MLGLCSHEPNFSLLREEVKFNRPKKGDKSRRFVHYVCVK
jgi:5'-3' exonuclease